MVKLVVGGNGFGDLVDDEADAVEDLVAAGMLRQQISQSLAQLPRLQRRILSWRFGLDNKPQLTVAAIAERTGLSMRSVHRMQQEALLAMRGQLAGWDGYAAA